VVGSLWLLSTSISISSPPHAIYNGDPSPSTPADAVLEPAPVHRNQVVIRTVPTNSAGLGSVIAQLRSSAAFATMLGATLSTFSVVSTHLTQYRAAEIVHLDLLETRLDANATVCSVESSPYYVRTTELIEGWCNNPDLREAQALELRGYFSNCTVILDDRPWDVRYDMSKCTWEWVKHVFSALRTKKQAGGIGIHVRWGDMSISTPENDPITRERSTPIDVAAQLLRKMRQCGMQDELSVYMEWHNTTMLSGLGEPYRIVDSGDSGLNDLLDLASNRVMVLDISSYTVLAHQIADGGITIVPDIDLFGITWHDNGVNHVLRWGELLSIPCSDLDTLLAS